MKHTIYALVDPDTRHVRYVGRTSQTLQRRLSGHLTAASGGNKSAVYQWMRSLYPIQPLPIVLQEIEGYHPRVHVGEGRYHSPIESIEIKWIKRFRRTVLNGINPSARAYKALVNKGEE
ncbi:MAG TPA: GIY-YIG nuclease family protein [Terriglobales bacterium]|jgi:hypothetical protein